MGRIRRKQMEKKYCNYCGRALTVINGILHEDVLMVEKEWGYFSEKDMEIDTFRICEACYDRLTREFAIPPHRRKKTEAM